VLRPEGDDHNLGTLQGAWQRHQKLLQERDASALRPASVHEREGAGGKTPKRGATRIDALTSDATSLIWKLIKAPTKVEYDEVMTRLLSINPGIES
jgi:hypothetical protein